MRQISLILVVYDQLAPGEREERVARAHDRAWRPLLDALDDTPGVRLALHMSGTLTDWMESERSDSLDRLAGLVDRDQVEYLGGSPVGAALQSLPERDATAHLQGTARWAQGRLGARPRGIWHGAGGWDPALPRILARGGMHYTFVERALIETGGRDVDGRSPWYIAEREGAAVGVLPLDPRLPALIPWALPRYVAHELKAKALAGERFVVAAIPGESLGLRHGTRHWCWNADRGWVPTFLRLLKNQVSWLKTLLPRQAIDGQRPGGRVYPSAGTPSASGMHALPAHLARAWYRTRREIDKGLDPGALRYGRWIVGPSWEAHLSRRDESNQIHKRMLRASATVQRLRRNLRDDKGRQDPARIQAYEHARGWLYAGQSGAVLHGSLAGGIDRPDLRHAAWKSLLTAEDIAREATGEKGAIRHEVQDIDCDGHREVVVTTPHFSIVVRPSMGGAVGELGLWRLGNLVNGFRREEESWHEGLAFTAQLPVLVDGSGVVQSGFEEDVDDDDSLIDSSEEVDTVGTVYTDQIEAVALPEPPPLPAPDGDVAAGLIQDRHHRLLFQEHFLGPGTTLENLRRDQHPQEGDFLDAPYSLLSAERLEGNEVHISMAREGVVNCDGVQRLVRVVKRLVLRRDSPVMDVSYDVANRYREPVRSRFAVELNLGLDGADTDERFLQSGDRRSMLDQDGTWAEVTDVALVLGDLGVRVQIWTGEPATVYFYRTRSLVRTCEGYEEANQGTCLVLAWDLELWGEEKRRFDIYFTIDGL